ncbi:fibronectin type III domain-containing protein [Granulicella cerasi]|uniref:fibronectin type III domain-containing protein n=1 Tax=Granulicella cerasi TaxID=741063 RepID=UPI0021E0F34B|nr:hypothetical protein [Granulicella cerasi]
MPKPPSLHLPAFARKLSAERVGDRVTVRFTVSTRTTDGVLLRDRDALRAQLCREVEHGPCLALIALTLPVAPGSVHEITDALPLQFSAGAPKLLGYRIELLNARGRSAGASDPVFVAGGNAPPVMATLRAQGSRLGVVLQWQPVPDAGDVTVERTAAGATKPVLLKPEGGGDPGRMVDTSAKEDVPYRYSAHREKSVSLGNRSLKLLGEDAAVSYTLHDVYPPPAPQGLTTAGFRAENGTWAVDLIWDPVEDADLAGYNVYRVDSAGARLRLNDKPIATPAFHDATAKEGVAYTWRVTAVDRHGNESAAATASVTP